MKTVDRITFERILAQEFYKEKNDIFKQYYEQIAITNRILENIEIATFLNLYPTFKEDILNIIKLRYIKKQKLELILKKANKELNRNYYKYSKDYKFNLYEKLLITQYWIGYKSIKHQIIMDCLKIFYLLDKRFAEVKIFERKYRNLIMLSFEQNLEMDKTIQLLLNKCFKLLNSIKLLSSKEQIKCSIILTKTLITFESIQNNKKINTLIEKYRYQDILFIFNYIQEIKSFENKVRSTVIMKNIIELVFKQIKIEKINILLLKKEIMKKFAAEYNLNTYSIVNQTWLNVLWNNCIFNYICYGTERWLQDLKKISTSIVALNDKLWTKRIKKLYTGGIQ